MTLQEAQEKTDNLIKGLLEIGFTYNNMGSYIFNFSVLPKIYRNIVITPQINSQFVYVIETYEDGKIDMVTLFNSDTHGELTIEWVTNLVKLLKILKIK